MRVSRTSCNARALREEPGPRATRHDAATWAPALQRTTPDDASHRQAAALRPGHKRRNDETFNCVILRCEACDAARCAASAHLGVTGVKVEFALSIFRPADTPSQPRGSNSPELCLRLHPQIQEGAGKAGCRQRTRGLLRKMHTQKNRTAAYRWCRSLGLPCAMVGRLMPCSPGSRTFLLASLAVRIDDAVRPVGLARIFDPGLTVATTARTTRFCRTHGPPCRRSIPWLRRQSRKLTGETKPSSAVRPHAVTDSQGLPALPAPLVPTLPRPPQARLAIKTTSRSPLLVEPGSATHTPKPNFGKVEYFRADGLTGRDTAKVP